MIFRDTLHVRTTARGNYDLTDKVVDIVSRSGIQDGLCHVFLRHTSASLILCENADPTVRTDLERFMARAVKDGDPLYEHDMEGPDDMPAHIRSILAGVAVSVPVVSGRLMLGTWQGIYLWEHRTAAHDREVIVTVNG